MKQYRNESFSARMLAINDQLSGGGRVSYESQKSLHAPAVCCSAWFGAVRAPSHYDLPIYLQRANAPLGSSRASSIRNEYLSCDPDLDRREARQIGAIATWDIGRQSEFPRTADASAPEPQCLGGGEGCRSGSPDEAGRGKWHRGSID